MITQIYSVTSTEQAEMCVGLGINHIGFVPNLVDNTAFDRWLIPFWLSKDITESLRGKAQSVALTFSNNVEEILFLTRGIEPDYIHLSTTWERMPLTEIRQLVDQIHNEGVRVMRTIAVQDATSVDYAIALDGLVDVLLLDTYSGTGDDIGTTGEVNNWEICRRIVENVNTQVILAGGLEPGNVREAIDSVRPWGVDSMTKTDVDNSKHMRKDYQKIKQFVISATSA